MPIYEYCCSDCGFQFETLHGMGELLKDCPECGKSKLDKLLSTGVVGKVNGSNTPCPKNADMGIVHKEKTPTPFWRKGDANPKILKNPMKYIETGKTDG